MNTPELPDALRAHLEVSFDLVRPLGEGGMGVVWLGRDRLLEREVAIKVLRTDTADTADGARRFLQEARMAARLQHPGVVPLLTFGEVGGHRYYVMPYARGETLADRIRRGPLSEDETRRIIAEVADALAYVHAQGIVHRDVKPANILLEEGTGRAMLTDFGIARGAGSTTLTATGMVVGTPLYLAPEQATGGADKVDGRADQYALGVVAWEALTGTSPFTGATPQEVLVRKMVEGVPSVRHSLPAVKPALADAIERATAVDAAARWQNAAEFAAAVRGSDDADPDPVELRPLRGAATGWIVLGTPVLWTFLLTMSTVPTAAPLWMRLSLPAVIAAGMSSLIAYGRCESLRVAYAPQRSWRELLPLVMRPLSFWFAWWPRQWTGFDLAEHVPDWLARDMLRERRLGTVSLGLIGMIGVLLATMSVATGEELVQSKLYQLSTQGTWDVWGILLAYGFIMLPLILHVKMTKRLKSLGINRDQVSMIGWRAFDASILREPFMQPLLSARSTLPEEPRELPALVDAIAALGAQLQAAGWPFGDLTPFLAEVRAADAQWAREADELAADADPVEATRLRERLSKLQGAARGGAHQDEMVRLIERQLELQERATERRRAILARRDRLREGCALLWRQLRSLRAEHARREDSGEITGRIRALCADVSNDISAEHETAKLVTPRTD